METEQTETNFSSTSFLTTIGKEDINNLPLYRYKGEVVVVSRQADVEDAVAALRTETILGFDTETRPSFRRGQNHPAALLQLAGASRVYLFQLLQLQDLQPLIDLLTLENVLKVGVAIRDDIRKLQDKDPFRPGGFVELADITQKAGVVNTGLRSLSAIFLGVRVSKGAQVSNWSKTELTEAQINYAATDAWISRSIYMRLLELGLADEAALL